MTEREFATGIVRSLTKAGYEALWAGGCVRDRLLGIEPADYDVATSATPDQVRHIFRRTVEVGLSFGVVEVLGPFQLKVQIATFRSDGAYSDGRRPDSVTFCNAEEDAKRRDFTINGMFFDPVRDRVIDYVGGQADLDLKVLQAIGDPFARFSEDKLRILRAVRFAGRFDLKIDPSTAAAMRQMASQTTVVSPERIADELRKMLKHPTRARALNDLFEYGLMPFVLPELGDERFELPRISAILDRLPSTSFTTVFAVLFSFLKPVPDVKRKRNPPLENLCRRLKFSNEERERIVWLVEHRDAFRDLPKTLFSAYQPLLIHPGIGELIDVHRAFGIDVEAVEALLHTLTPVQLDPPPFVTGEDLIARGIPQGPQFKHLLGRIRERQLDGTVLNREDALEALTMLQKD